MRASDEMTIGNLARRTGLAVSAIRYYEEQGLIHPERNSGGQRRFRRSDIRRLSFVKIAQQFGYTLPRIASLMDTLPEGRTPTKRDWEKISRSFRKTLDEQIQTLEQMRDNLDGCIGCGCLSLKKCRLYNDQDRAARLGPGPRYMMGDRPKDLD